MFIMIRNIVNLTFSHEEKKYDHERNGCLTTQTYCADFSCVHWSENSNIKLNFI